MQAWSAAAVIQDGKEEENHCSYFPFRLPYQYLVCVAHKAFKKKKVRCHESPPIRDTPVLADGSVWLSFYRLTSPRIKESNLFNPWTSRDGAGLSALRILR